MADLERHEELVVTTKTYDLILRSCNHTGKFPHNHRFVLGERIERNLYDLLETLIRAKYTKNRQELLDQANLVLDCQRFQGSAVSQGEKNKSGGKAPQSKDVFWSAALFRRFCFFYFGVRRFSAAFVSIFL